jgi:hypothetical protein
MSSNSTVHAGEPRLVAFISSVMDHELEAARARVESVLSTAPFLLTWAFENTPASSQDVDESYLEKVRRSAFVFWLVGTRTTDPVKREVEEALASNRRLIVLKLPAEKRDATTTALLERVRPVAKYREVGGLDQLAVEVDLAVSDEINRALQDLPGMSRVARLDELGRASRARCIERWEVAGVDTAQALELANDVAIGAAPDLVLPDDARPLRVLCGDMGVGKSLAGERFHQAAIAVQLSDATAPIPVYLRARDIGDDLQATVLPFTHGLGDARQHGATIVVDGIDEPGSGVAADLLRQARILARTWPATRVLVTSRPLSAFEDATDVAVLPQLARSDANQLVGRIAGIAVTPGREAGWPENLRQAIRLPLFAVLLGCFLRRTGGVVPTSRGELLRDLVERAIGRVDKDVRPLLRCLAVRSLLRGGGPVPEGDIVGAEDASHLEDTRLIVRRDRTLVFPLIVLAQWFAAESLIAGDPTPEELTDDPSQLEAWRYPLAIAVGTYGYEQVSTLLGPLAHAHAGFASQVVEEGLAKWSLAEDVLPPTARECGHQVRTAAESWAAGAGSAKTLLWPLVREGALGAIGAHVEGHWLTTGWYAGQTNMPDVNELPDGLSGLLMPQSQGTFADWAAVHGARPGRQAAWAWRWSFEQLRSALDQHLKARAIPLFEGPLADAELWATLCSLFGSSFLHDEPIPIQQAIDVIPTDADIVLAANGRRVRTGGLVPALKGRLAAGQVEVQPPFPGADLPVSGGFVWNAWSEHRLMERTTAIFAAALLGYEALATSVFADLAPWMQTAVTLPAILHGHLNPGNRALGFAGGPTITWWLEALPRGDTSRVDIKIEHLDKRDEQHNEFRGAAHRSRAVRPQQARWLNATMHSSVLDVFELWSAQELVYHWLWNDLRRISWADGILGVRPTGFGF